MNFITIIALLILIIIPAFKKSFLIVQQSEAYIIERLGNYHRTLNSGLNFVNPFIDKIKAKIDLREQIMEIPMQGIKTKDNQLILVGIIIFYQITNPVKAYYDNLDADSLANNSFFKSSSKLRNDIYTRSMSTIKNVISNMNLQEVKNSNEKNFNVTFLEELKYDDYEFKLDSTTCGYEITRVALKIQ